LPEDYVAVCKQTLGRLSGDLAAHGQTVLEKGWLRLNKRIFNNAQISDHFAIIPTGTGAKHLDEMESTT
jgi:DNA topoisomerase-3